MSLACKLSHAVYLFAVLEKSIHTSAGGHKPIFKCHTDRCDMSTCWRNSMIKTLSKNNDSYFSSVEFVFWQYERTVLNLNICVLHQSSLGRDCHLFYFSQWKVCWGRLETSWHQQQRLSKGSLLSIQDECLPAPGFNLWHLNFNLLRNKLKWPDIKMATKVGWCRQHVHWALQHLAFGQRLTEA